VAPGCVLGTLNEWKLGEIDYFDLVNVSTGEKFVLSWTFLLLKQEFVLHGDVLRKQVYLIIWENFGDFYPDVFGRKTP
jgi:hypothetical protein